MTSRILAALLLLTSGEVRAQMPTVCLGMGCWSDMPVDCDRGIAWLREHNFKSCITHEVIEQSCVVPTPDAEKQDLTCVIIPQPR